MVKSACHSKDEHADYDKVAHRDKAALLDFKWTVAELSVNSLTPGALELGPSPG